MRLQVAERGLSFIQSFSGILEAREREGQVPPQFGAAWAFAAALSLASTLSTLQARRVELRRAEQGRGPGGRRCVCAWDPLIVLKLKAQRRRMACTVLTVQLPALLLCRTGPHQSLSGIHPRAP